MKYKEAIAVIYKNIRLILVAVVVLGAFVFFSWLSRQYGPELSGSVFFTSVYAELIYFSISVLTVVIAGFSASPLIPLANTLWGPTATALLTSLGWTAGAMIAFWLARRFGEKLVCRIVNKCDFEDYHGSIGAKGLFWKVLLARILLPVDILSYAIGLFTKMSWLPFLLATFIGSYLFTLLAIFVSGLTIKAQLIAGALIIFVFFYRIKEIIRSVLSKK